MTIKDNFVVFDHEIIIINFHEFMIVRNEKDKIFSFFFRVSSIKKVRKEFLQRRSCCARFSHQQYQKRQRYI